MKLLDRSKRPFVLTPEGKVYYEGCRKLVQRFYALEEEVTTLHQEVEGRVSIACIYSIGLTHLNGWSRTFTERYPRAKVVMDCHHPNLVYEMVEDNRVDFGLVSYPKSTRTIRGTVWSHEPYVLVCSPEHPFASRSGIDQEELNGIEIIGFDAGLKVRQELDRELSSRKIQVSVVMEFDNTPTITSAIDNYAGIGLVPAFTAKRDIERGTLIEVPVTGLQLARPIGLIQRRGLELGKTARRFIQETESSLGNGAREPDTTGQHMPESAQANAPTTWPDDIGNGDIGNGDIGNGDIGNGDIGNLGSHQPSSRK